LITDANLDHATRANDDLSGRPEGSLGAARARPVRVVYCTRGGLFGALVQQRLQQCERIQICGIVRSSRMMRPELGLVRGTLAYLRRSGVAYSLYLWCATTLADAFCHVARFDTKHTVPVFNTRDVNDPQGIRFLQDCAPDLLVSAFFDQRLQQHALGIPRLGCINIHPSLLPAFKGVDPVLQARLQGAPRIGVTVHRMVPELDAGAVVAQRALITPKTASIFETTALLFREGAELLVLALERIERGAAGIEQRGQGNYQSWPSRAEVRSLQDVKVPLIRLSDFLRVRSAMQGARPVANGPR
jgi:methionyl-tRNA formyltransferase